MCVIFILIGVYGTEILELRFKKILQPSRQPFLGTQISLGNYMKSTAYPFYSIIKYLKLLNETFNCPQPKSAKAN